MFISRTPLRISLVGERLLPLALLLAGPACDSRSVPGGDASGLDASSASDGSSAPDAASHTCNKLVAMGTTLLGPKSQLNARPALTHDGTRFGVAWLHGKDFSATNQATLRFTRVDAAGKADNTAGVEVGAAISVVPPGLAYGGGEYGLLYRAPSPAIGDVSVLSRLGPDGSARHKAVTLGGNSREVTLARSGNGYAALLVEPGSSASYTLQFATVDAKGTVKRKKIHSGAGYWLNWLAPRTGGYAAAWGNTFARLDPGGAVQHTATLKNGMSAVYSASAVGYAVAYIDLSASSKENVRFQLLDPQGKPVGPPRMAGTSAGFGAMIARYIALVWTGGMHVVVYTRYPGAGSQLVAQLLDSKGISKGQPVAVPVCSPKQPGVNLAAAWGGGGLAGGTLAVAAMGGYSANSAAQLCLSRMRCMP